MKLAVASVPLITGCTHSRQVSDLNAAMTDLNRRLDKIADNDQQEQLMHELLSAEQWNRAFG